MIVICPQCGVRYEVISVAEAGKCKECRKDKKVRQDQFCDPDNPLARFRGTRRSSRMLDEVYNLCGYHRFICVVAVDYSSSDLLRDYFNQHYADSIKSFNKFETEVEGFGCVTRIMWRTAESKNWSWQRRNFEGMLKNTPIFIDHAAIEKRYREILELYHRYDQ